jgi:hypothetical protein
MTDELDEIERVLDHAERGGSMNNWRPDGWKNPWRGGLSGFEPTFEAGADAMYQPAHDKGYQEGLAEGRKDGWEDGFSQGMTLGTDEGKRVGLAQCEAKVKAREQVMDFDTFVKALYSAGWRAPNDAQHKGAKSLLNSLNVEAESRVKAREQEICQFCVDWCEMMGDAPAFAEKYGLHKVGHGTTAFLCDLESWLGKE